MSKLGNAVAFVERSNRNDLQDRVIEYFRKYQAARTKVAEFATDDVCTLPNYEQWQCLDNEFLRALRELSGQPQFGLLLSGVNAVGWGSAVTPLIEASTQSAIDAPNFGIDEQRTLVEALRADRGEVGEAHIQFLTINQKRLAETLKGIFEQAGWAVNWTSVPLNTNRNIEVWSGIEIRAYTDHRVTSISDLLSKAGLTISPTSGVDPFNISPGHAKYHYLAETVRIKVGLDA